MQGTWNRKLLSDRITLLEVTSENTLLELSQWTTHPDPLKPQLFYIEPSILHESIRGETFVANSAIFDCQSSSATGCKVSDEKVHIFDVSKKDFSIIHSGDGRVISSLQTAMGRFFVTKLFDLFSEEFVELGPAYGDNGFDTLGIGAMPARNHLLSVDSSSDPFDPSQKLLVWEIVDKNKIVKRDDFPLCEHQTLLMIADDGVVVNCAALDETPNYYGISLDHEGKWFKTKIESNFDSWLETVTKNIFFLGGQRGFEIWTNLPR